MVDPSNVLVCVVKGMSSSNLGTTIATNQLNPTLQRAIIKTFWIDFQNVLAYLEIISYVLRISLDKAICV